MEEAQAIKLNALSLAFLGDSVYTLFVRARAVEKMDALPARMNEYCRAFVRASAQAKAYKTLEPELTEEEKSVAHRARNSHPGNKAKNASVSDYMNATALEALIGYLYVTGREERLNYIQNKAMEVCDEQGG